MRWFLLQVLAIGILSWRDPRGGQELLPVYSLALLTFCGLWPAGRYLSEWRPLASLLFTSLLSFTGLMLLLQGPMSSLAVCWPALASRLEPERMHQRILLVVFQLGLLMLHLDDPLLKGLTTGLAAASLVQLHPGRPTRWFALGALALASGPLAIAHCMSDPPEHLIRNILLLTLPQLGLLCVTRSARRPRPDFRAI